MFDCYNPMGVNGIWRSKIAQACPIVYDDSLSVIQRLGLLTERVNTMREDLKALEKIVGSWQGSLDNISNTLHQHDLEIASLKGMVASQSAAIHSMTIRLDGIDREIEFLDDRITDSYTALLSEIDRLESQISISVLEMMRMIAKQYEALEVLEDVLNYKIDQQIATKSGATILTHNPVRGMVTVLNHTLADIWSAVENVGGIRFREYNALMITFHEYNAMGISYNDYNRNAGVVLRNICEIELNDKIRELEERVKLLADYIRDNIVCENKESIGSTISVKKLAEKNYDDAHMGCTFKEYNDAKIVYTVYNNAQIEVVYYGIKFLEYIYRSYALFNNTDYPIRVSCTGNRSHVILLTEVDTDNSIYENYITLNLPEGDIISNVCAYIFPTRSQGDITWRFSDINYLYIMVPAIPGKLKVIVEIQRREKNVLDNPGRNQGQKAENTE